MVYNKLNLPDCFTSDSQEISKISGYILKYILDSTIATVENTALSNYFSKEEVKELIDKRLIGVSVERYLPINRINIEDGNLSLNEMFFSQNINNYGNFLKFIEKYPVLGTILRTYGISIISNIDTNALDEKIKSSFAAFFVSKALSLKTAFYSVSDLKYKTHSPIVNCLMVNLIEQLSLTYGEDILAETLKKGTKVLTTRINNANKTKDLGESLMDGIINVYDTKEEMNEEISIVECYNLIREKAFLLKSFFRKYNSKDAQSLFRVFQLSGYNIEILKTFPGGESLISLDDDEKSVLHQGILEAESLNFFRKLLPTFEMYPETETQETQIFETRFESQRSIMRNTIIITEILSKELRPIEKLCISYSLHKCREKKIESKLIKALQYFEELLVYSMYRPLTSEEYEKLSRLMDFKFISSSSPIIEDNPLEKKKGKLGVLEV